MSPMLKLKVSNSWTLEDIAEGEQLKSMGDLVAEEREYSDFFGWVTGTKMVFLRVRSRKRVVDINGNVVIQI